MVPIVLYKFLLLPSYNKAAHDIEAKAKTYAPHKTGALRGSIHTQSASASNLVAKVGTNLVYARAQEMGRDPFILTPVNKKALCWKGAAHPVKVVHHPGFQGKFYMKQAKEETVPKLTSYLQEAGRQIINNLLGK